MSKNIASILVFGLLGSIFSFNVQAFSLSPVAAQGTDPLVTLVAGGCGIGFHRGPYGYCRPNGPRWAQVGTLRCIVNPSIGFIIAGHQSMECSFQQAGLPPQPYQGAINTVGLDIGVSEGGVLGWAVFASSRGIPFGALAGEYVGVSGDVGVGIGVGANVLMGGSARTFALQPVSLQGSVALNVALGVSGLKLRPVP